MNHSKKSEDTTEINTSRPAAQEELEDVVVSSWLLFGEASESRALCSRRHWTNGDDGIPVSFCRTHCAVRSFLPKIDGGVETRGVL